MKVFTIDLLLLMVLIFLMIWYEARRLMTKGKVMAKMSYDKRRLLLWMTLLPNAMANYGYYLEQKDMARAFKTTGLMTQEDYGLFIHNLELNTLLSVGGVLGIMLIAMWIDFRTYGVINQEGIFLHKFVPFKRITKYVVDHEFHYIELHFQAMGGRIKKRYLKLDQSELIQAHAICAKYISPMAQGRPDSHGHQALTVE